MLVSTPSSVLGAMLMLLGSSSIVNAQAPLNTNSSYELTGYLADMLCTRLEIAPDGANMLLNPQEHTVGCELLPACERSGYGIIQDLGSNGQSLYRVGAVLDEAANAYVVDLLESMENSMNDLRVKIKGTYLGLADAGETPAFTSRPPDTSRSWPAMNNVPLITLDALEFCNYDGPDAKPVFTADNVCSSSTEILKVLAEGNGADLANDNLCMSTEVTIASVDNGDNYMVNPDGCADHATFRDVQRADAQTCNPTNTCDDDGDDGTCAPQQCVNACGGSLLIPGTNRVAKSCCFENCGALYDACGFVYLDACSNPTLADGTTPCPAAQLVEDELNECVDGCGNPYEDRCGNPVTQCCLDGCNSPLVDPCNIPFLDPCGNPASDGSGTTCLPEFIAENDCLSSSTCIVEDACLDGCGNPLFLANGRRAQICCLESPCGVTALYNGCGQPYLDGCGNPTLADGTTACPANQIRTNMLNECLDGCGNPYNDRCGNPVAECCLDGCNSPLVDGCNIPFLDQCGNPASGYSGMTCLPENIGKNSCLSGCGEPCGGPSWRQRRTQSKRKKTRRTKNKRSRQTIANHNEIRDLQWCGCGAAGGGTCEQKCLDGCGNPLTLPNGRTAQNCCLESPCGVTALYNGCGHPYLDPCGNPTLADGTTPCPADQLATSAVTECVDGCGSIYEDACGNPVTQCCLDGCNSPLVDPCNIPFVDLCGNPASDPCGTTCLAEFIGVNSCESGSCVEDACLDGCGNPLFLANGRPVKTCCLESPCGVTALYNGCGQPYLDPCGNPTLADGTTACPADRIRTNTLNECLDGCGNPYNDACGNPVTECCLDGCNSPLVDGCNIPFLDQCGNPASDGCGTTCLAEFIAENECLGGGGGDDDTCLPAFFPATDSFQCPSLESPCTIAANGLANVTTGIPDAIQIQRRRRAMGEPGVPRYTPIRKDLQIKIPASPTPMRSRRELDPAHDGVIGVAVNGIPIVYEHPEEGANTLIFDSCGGHADLSNRYHYHLPPVCLLRSLGGTVPRNSDWWLAPSAENQWPAQARNNNSPLLGWAIDGHPIFGPYNPLNGELVLPGGAAGGGDEECETNAVLDECNGMVLENGVYAYFITPVAPFVPPCLMGDVPSDAFVDGGKLGDTADICPLEGTNPLAGTEICDEKAIIFQDDSCPGNSDRQAIRNCFELATSSFTGEPTCAQIEAAFVEAKSCFVSAGCCQDFEATLAKWKSDYPALESCTGFPESGCIAFGDDNVVSLSVTLDTPVAQLVPDTRASLRRAMAVTVLGNDEESLNRVSIERVTGDNATSTVEFGIAYATREEAAAAAQALDKAAISSALGASTGFTVSSLETEHVVPPEAPELWSTRNKLGLGFSLAAVVITLAILVYLEDFAFGSVPSHAGEDKKLVDESSGNGNDEEAPKDEA